MIYTYNVELEKPINGFKYWTLNFNEKLKKDLIYTGSNERWGKYKFKVVKQIKDGDLNIDDLDWIRVCIEGWDIPEVNKIKRKIVKAVKEGKIISFSKDEIQIILKYIVGDRTREEFEEEVSERDIELVDKIIKRYKYPWF